VRGLRLLFRKGAKSPSNIKSPGLRPTSIPSTMGRFVGGGGSAPVFGIVIEDFSENLV